METIRQILLYNFYELSPEIAARYKNAIENDEVLIDVVEGIKTFCQDYNIRTVVDFEQEWMKITKSNYPLTQHPAYAEEVYMAVDAKNVEEPYGDALRDFCENIPNALPGIIKIYAEQKTISFIWENMYNKEYSKDDLILDIFTHLKQMRDQLDNEAIEKIFLDELGNIKAKRTCNEILYHKKYTPGDNKSLVIMTKDYCKKSGENYYALMFFCAYKYYKDSWPKDEAIFKTQNAIDHIMEKFIKRNKNRHRSFFHSDTNQVNFMRTFCKRLYYKFVDDWRSEYGRNYDSDQKTDDEFEKKNKPDEFESQYIPLEKKRPDATNLPDTNAPFYDHLKLGSNIKWPNAKFLSIEQKQTLDKLDDIRKLSVRKLRRDGRLHDGLEFEICCYDNLQLEHEEIVEKTGSDKDTVRKLKFSIERSVRTLETKIRKELIENGGKYTNDHLDYIRTDI